MPRDDFEERRARRIERLQARAALKQREGNALIEQSTRMGDAIPMGQPILVGHHSEKRDRNYRARMHNKMRKGVDTLDYAAQLAHRAAAAEENTAIFSDDPKATEKLEEKLARLEKQQALMTAANKCVRKNDREGLLDLGFSETRIEQLFTPDFVGRLGFPSYALTNNSARIRDVKKRIANLKAQANDKTTELMIGEVKIVDNVEENRVQLYFPGKPDDQTRQMLKTCGFKWSPYGGCWQRHRGGWALTYPKSVAEKLTQENQVVLNPDAQ